MSICPQNDKVYTYVYIKENINGYEVEIIATIDGVNPELESPLMHWPGCKENLLTFIFLMFKNPIIKESE